MARGRGDVPTGTPPRRRRPARDAGRPGTSVLRNIYVINRGYEDLADRLNNLGATIEVFRDI